MAVEGSVPAPGVVVPHLVVRSAEEAVNFYVQAFAATVLYRSPSPSGAGEHIHLKVWNSLIQVSTEEPSQRDDRVEGALLASPETLLGSTCVFQIGVPDVDSAYERASVAPVPPCLPWICSGETATAGCATLSATSGPYLPFKKCSPRKRSSADLRFSPQT